MRVAIKQAGGQGPQILGTLGTQALHNKADAPPPDEAGPDDRALGRRRARPPPVGWGGGGLWGFNIDLRKAFNATFNRADDASPGVASDSGGAVPPDAAQWEVVGWSQLESSGKLPGKVLELRVVTKPEPSLRWSCLGEDKEGETALLAFYSQRPPKGLKRGAVLRWSNPRYHLFLDGQEGARIEDEDLPNITIL